MKPHEAKLFVPFLNLVFFFRKNRGISMQEATPWWQHIAQEQSTKITVCAD